MITLQNISLTLGRQASFFQNVTTTIHAGQRIAIIGQNGVGKSTLLKLIAGSIQPTAGTLLYQGRDITSTSLQERSLFIGQLFQNPLSGCIGSFTVAENCMLAATKGRNPTLHKPHIKHLQPLINHWAEVVHLNIAGLWNQPMHTLSGGQQQLISFIMLVLSKPQVVLLDEPTAALNPKTASHLAAAAHIFLAENSITMLCVTHDYQVAAQIATDTWELLPHGVIKK